MQVSLCMVLSPPNHLLHPAMTSYFLLQCSQNRCANVPHQAACNPPFARAVFDLTGLSHLHIPLNKEHVSLGSSYAHRNAGCCCKGSVIRSTSDRLPLSRSWFSLMELSGATDFTIDILLIEI